MTLGARRPRAAALVQLLLLLLVLLQAVWSGR